jgi:aminopeptidase
MFGLEKELEEKVERKSHQFHQILKKCLKIKNENVLIISDYGEENRQLSTMLSYGYYHAAKNKGLKVEILFQERKKGFMHADHHVIKALEKLEKGSIIILTLSKKLGRIGAMKSFRGFCKENEHRFISATGLADAKTNHYELFMEAMNINYTRLAKKGLTIKKKLDKAEIIRIKTDAGTDITFNVSGMEARANVGSYKEKGSGGNMPAGEIYIPPKGYYGVKGKIVIDGSMKTHQGTILLDQPVTLHIEEGRVVKIEGKSAHLLEKTFIKYEDRAKYPYRVRHIGELGIGINPGAILIGSTIIDEKALGTAHVGIGSNYWFGGDIRTVFHGDQIFKNPRIFIDGELLKI